MIQKKALIGQNVDTRRPHCLPLYIKSIKKTKATVDQQPLRRSTETALGPRLPLEPLQKKYLLQNIPNFAPYNNFPLYSIQDQLLSTAHSSPVCSVSSNPSRVMLITGFKQLLPRQPTVYETNHTHPLWNLHVHKLTPSIVSQGNPVNSMTINFANKHKEPSKIPNRHWIHVGIQVTVISIYNY